MVSMSERNGEGLSVWVIDLSQYFLTNVTNTPFLMNSTVDRNHLRTRQTVYNLLALEIKSLINSQLAQHEKRWHKAGNFPFTQIQVRLANHTGILCMYGSVDRESVKSWLLISKV
jgi:hypothetical protein